MKHPFNVALNGSVILQQVGNGRIQIPFLALGHRHLFIVLNRIVARHGTHKSQEFLFGMFQLRQENVRQHNGTGIDERIAGNPLLYLQLNQRIEGCTRRLLPHPLPEVVTFQRQTHRQGKDLGDTLNRKTGIRLLDGINLPINGMNAHTELVGIHLRQCRDIIRLLAFLGIRKDALINIFKNLLIIHSFFLFCLQK